MLRRVAVTTFASIAALAAVLPPTRRKRQGRGP
jgi:hypothetical protein